MPGTRKSKHISKRGLTLGLILAGMLIPALLLSGSLAAEPPPPPPNLPDLSASIGEAVLAAARESEETLALLIFPLEIERIEISRDRLYAITWLNLLDPQTGENLPAEPAVAISRWDGREWQTTFNIQDGFERLLAQVPLDLLSETDKLHLLELYDYTCSTFGMGPYGGYKLPWRGGTALYLSRSITHAIPESENPTGSMFYSFDFYASGTPMFELYASKTGTVKWFRDSQVNGDPAGPGNYIVLEDRTTNPVTYQLYLHLAQNSIPPDLKVVGAPVLQGQYIGLADDTGASSANHLHFQVHTVPTSYWGCAVDIVFDEVTVNGGRPRTSLEASLYPQYGNQWQNPYLSQNYASGDSIPPVGDMLEPFTNGFVWTSRNIPLEGWATDQGSGLLSANFIANLHDAWRIIGPTFNTSLFSTTWDACAAGLPSGAVQIGLQLRDFANNYTPGLPGQRQGLFTVNCPSTPPACTITSNQVALFTGVDGRGACQVFNVGQTDDLTLTQLASQPPRSILVGSGVVATLYSLPNRSGRSQSFIAADYSLADDLIGASARSLNVSARAAAPSAPLLTWPLPDASLGSQPSVVFAWRDGGGTQGGYQLEVSQGGSVVFSATPSRAYASAGSLGPGAYTWRVRPAGTDIWSETRSFTVDSVSLPNSPTLSAPWSDDLEAGNDGWTMSGAWGYLDDTAKAHSATHSFTFGNYNSGLPVAGDLTSPPITLPAGSSSMRFYSRYQTESTGSTWDQRRVQISSNGGAFVDLYQFTDDPMDAWLASPWLDLSAYAGQTIRLRFHFASLDEHLNTHSGWSIDDLTIQATPAFGCAAGDAGDTYNTATTISLGATINGQICPPGDLDVYKVSLTAGNRISIDLDAVSAGSTLDTYLDVYDIDGRSLINSNDDEVIYEVTDSHLGLLIQRTGVYYLRIKAWNHPDAGGSDATYTLRTVTDNSPPTLSLPGINDNGVIPAGDLILSPADSGASGLRLVEAWWRPNDWTSGAWTSLGKDHSNLGGWQLSWAGVPEQAGMHLYALVEDWAGSRAFVLRQNLTLDRTPPTVSLTPPSSSYDSSAVLLRWTNQDNLSGVQTVSIQSRPAGSADWATLGNYPASTTQAWFTGGLDQTYEIRLQAVDQAGNLQAYPDAPQASFTIQGCTAADAWDAAPFSDNTFEQATPLVFQAGAQQHNFCTLGDADWLRFTVDGNTAGDILLLSQHATTAVHAVLYQVVGGVPEVLLDQSAPVWGNSLILRTRDLPPGEYALRLAHTNPGQVAGNAVAYNVLWLPIHDTYLPWTNR